MFIQVAIWDDSFSQLTQESVFLVNVVFFSQENLSDHKISTITELV